MITDKLINRCIMEREALLAEGGSYNKGTAEILDQAIKAMRQQQMDDLDAERVADKMRDLLTKTANALKGEPGPLRMHSWHDLPEVAKALKKQVDGPEEKCGDIYGVETRFDGNPSHAETCLRPKGHAGHHSGANSIWARND